MGEQQITKAIVTRDGRMLVEQPDGSYRLAEGRTDWAAVDAMTEEELEAAIASDPDDPGNDPTFWEKAVPVYPVPKARITMRLDQDIVDFFRRQGRGYQTRIQAVLRAYVEAHRHR
ncbi:MAG: BrnA antitoxin family protein [Geminicoccaceae bacterium]|nr:BrnA antitoxin family protein [Geminicoccaceae bacterium]